MNVAFSRQRCIQYTSFLRRKLFSLLLPYMGQMSAKSHTKYSHNLRSCWWSELPSPSLYNKRQAFKADWYAYIHYVPVKAWGGGGIRSLRNCSFRMCEKREIMFFSLAKCVKQVKQFYCVTIKKLGNFGENTFVPALYLTRSCKGFKRPNLYIRRRQARYESLSILPKHKEENKQHSKSIKFL